MLLKKKRSCVLLLLFRDTIFLSDRGFKIKLSYYKHFFSRTSLVGKKSLVPAWNSNLYFTTLYSTKYNNNSYYNYVITFLVVLQRLISRGVTGFPVGLSHLQDNYSIFHVAPDNTSIKSSKKLDTFSHRSSPTSNFISVSPR